MDQYHHADHVVASLPACDDPIICHRPHAAARAAKAFLSGFAGETFFAVKANPHPRILDALSAAGITHFDVASPAEIRLIRRRVPGATLAYMHPIKSPSAIAEAYTDHDVRIFALDSQDELEKIMGATGGAGDLTLAVRLRVDNGDAKMDLGKKFGADAEEAVALLQAARGVADRLVISFHVGSQSMAPAAYANALGRVAEVVGQADVSVDIIDVGGGFPADYPGSAPQPLGDYFAAIEAAREAHGFSKTPLWAEPGRALVAGSASTIVRVDGRRGDTLYINDGVYGTLYDAGHFHWRYPVRLVGRESAAEDRPFALYGPTCDDADHMPGPFPLPADITVGDYIEVGNLGAYGQTMIAPFNGFGTHREVVCTDDPFNTLSIQGLALTRAE